MQNATLVSCRQASSETEAQFGHFRSLKWSRQPIEAQATHKLRDEKRLTKDFADSVNAHDVAVGKSCDGTGLNQESLSCGGIFVERQQKLESHRTVKQGVVGEVDAAHGTLAKRPYQAVFLDRWQLV